MSVGKGQERTTITETSVGSQRRQQSKSNRRKEELECEWNGRGQESECTLKIEHGRRERTVRDSKQSVKAKQRTQCKVKEVNQAKGKRLGMTAGAGHGKQQTQK